MNRIIKVALLQTRCIGEKSKNLNYIQESIRLAAKQSSKICVLGQICNSPYTKKYMEEFAEEIQNSQTLNLLKKLSKQFGIYTISSIPIRSKQNKLFNSGIVTSPEGQLISRMNKIHLFDINIPGKITYKESDVFDAGKEICVFDTIYGKMGLGICYDVRFAQLGLLMRQKGAKVLIYPGSFNFTTGPLHWELLLRARALDNQCYAIGVSTAQNKQDPTVYQAYGHSIAVDPFGKVLTQLDQNPGITYFDLNLDYIEQVREQIPISKQKRNDLYQLIQK